MEIHQVAKALSSQTRIKLLKILNNKQMSSMAIFTEYNIKNNDNKHRESIYRSLEILVKAGILDKKYDVQSKEILYQIKINEVKINLKNLECEMIG